MIADCGHIYTDKLLGQLDDDKKAKAEPKPPRRTPRGTQRMTAPVNIDLADLDDGRSE